MLTIPSTVLLPGQSYTAVAYDELASISALAMNDDFADLAATDIRVRAIHAGAAVGAVDIWNLPEGADAALLYDDVELGDVGDYFDLPAGAYTLGVDADNDAIPDLVFALPDLPAGTIANVFAVESTGIVTLYAQLQDSTVAIAGAGTTSIRVIHLSPDGPAVDVFVDGSATAAVDSLAFESSTPYIELPSLFYSFDVAAEDAGVGASVLTIPSALYRPDRFYTAVAFNVLASIQALALEDDYADLAGTDIRVRAVHAAAGVGQVDVWNVTAGSDAALLYEDVDFGAAGDYLDLAAGTYSIGFDTDNDESPDLTFDLPALAAGAVVTLYAVNEGGVYLVAQFGDGTTASIDPS